MDIDMLGRTSNDPSQIIRQMQEIIALRVEQRWHGVRPSIARNRANYQGYRDTIKVYRHYLVQRKYERNTIALKLSAVRRFYDAAIEYGLLIPRKTDVRLRGSHTKSGNHQ
jgi:hypothetical protein